MATDMNKNQGRKKLRLNIKKGDIVYVIAGSYKHHRGRVLEVMPREERAIVEGVNMVSHHEKPNAQNTQGGIVQKEAPIHISNLQLIDPDSGKPTRIGHRRNENGKLVRFAKKSNKEIR